MRGIFLLTSISHDVCPEQPVHFDLLIRQGTGSSRMEILKKIHIKK
jgi:hypothetical protein